MSAPFGTDPVALFERLDLALTRMVGAQANLQGDGSEAAVAVYDEACHEATVVYAQLAQCMVMDDLRQCLSVIYGRR